MPMLEQGIVPDGERTYQRNPIYGLGRVCIRKVVSRFPRSSHPTGGITFGMEMIAGKRPIWHDPSSDRRAAWGFPVNAVS